MMPRRIIATAAGARRSTHGFLKIHPFRGAFQIRIANTETAFGWSFCLVLGNREKQKDGE
jgi:hypothetical protein